MKNQLVYVTICFFPLPLFSMVSGIQNFIHFYWHRWQKKERERNKKGYIYMLSPIIDRSNNINGEREKKHPSKLLAVSARGSQLTGEIFHVFESQYIHNARRFTLQLLTKPYRAKSKREICTTKFSALRYCVNVNGARLTSTSMAGCFVRLVRRN